jgi:hypothetical protein
MQRWDCGSGAEFILLGLDQGPDRDPDRDVIFEQGARVHTMTEGLELEKTRLLPEFAPNAPPVSELTRHLRKHRGYVLVAFGLNAIVAGLAAPLTYLGLKVGLGFGVVIAVGLGFGVVCTLMMVVTSMLQFAEEIRTSTGPHRGLNRPEQLFALACESNNPVTARTLYATGGINVQTLCGEALRLWAEKKSIEATPRPWTPEAGTILAWLLTEVATKAPAQLWASTNPDWTELVMAWAAGNLALGPRWPGTTEAIFGAPDRQHDEILVAQV